MLRSIYKVKQTNNQTYKNVPVLDSVKGTFVKPVENMFRFNTKNFCTIKLLIKT